MMLGIDLDSKNHFRMLKVYFNAKAIVEPDIKETQHGFHLRLPLDVDIQDQLTIRHLLSDCKERMAWDEIKLQMGLVELVDTLFEAKQGKDDKCWHHEEPFNPLAQPFWEPRKTIKNRRWKAWLRHNGGD